MDRAHLVRLGATSLAAISVAALVGCAEPAPPPPPPAPPPTPVVTTGVREITATVETVDMTYRHLLVRGPQGNLITLVVDPSVRNLGQVKPGDRITLRYAAAIAAQLTPPSAKPRNEVVRVGARTPEGARPGGVLGERRTVTVQVTGIDLANNTVSFVPPDGQPRTVLVRDPSMQDFLRHLKVGDRVDITYAEAVAVSVEPGV